MLILQDADSHSLLEKSVIPLTFSEDKPNAIRDSLAKFVSKSGTYPKVSISERVKSGFYHRPYQLFHDISVLATLEIVKHPVGSPVYLEIDNFFEYASERLFHETKSLHLSLIERELPDTQLDILRDDFVKISSEFLTRDSEALSFINTYEEQVAPAIHTIYGQQAPPTTKSVSQPLFSSITGKSSLDWRETVVPDPYNLLKVTSYPKAVLTNTSTLKGFGNISSRIPAPSQASSQVLENFFHPNWYTIEAPKWISYEKEILRAPVESTLIKNGNATEYRATGKATQMLSFAPATDSRSAVLGEELRNAVWVNHVGLLRISKISPTNGSSELHAAAKDESAPKIATPVTEDTDDLDTVNPSGKVLLENLVKFDPEAATSIGQMKREIKQVLKSPAVLQKHILALTIKLNMARQERLLSSGSKPSSNELILYKKIKTYMRLLLSSQAGAVELDIPHSHKLPILTTDYHGTLPGPVPSKGGGFGRPGRISGMRGPYKKKSRFV